MSNQTIFSTVTPCAISDLQDGEVLLWNDTTKRWENSAAPAGSGDVTASGTLTNNAVALGGGNAVVKTTTTGTGVVAALGEDVTGDGSIVLNETPIFQGPIQIQNGSDPVYYFDPTDYDDSQLTFYAPPDKGWMAVADDDGNAHWVLSPTLARFAYHPNYLDVTSSGFNFLGDITMQGDIAGGLSADSFFDIQRGAAESRFFRQISTPVAIENVMNIKATKVLGDNTTLIGGRALELQAEDDATVGAGTKGYLNGLSISLIPKIARNNTPFDDATGLHIQNNGTRKGSDALFVGQGASSLDPTDWDAIFSAEAAATFGLHWIGTVGTGFYMRNVTTMADLAAPNAGDFVWKMAADNNDDATDQWILKILATGNSMTWTNNSNVRLTLDTAGVLSPVTMQPTTAYKSVDGSTGASSTGAYTTITSITVKNGLVTAISGS